MAKSGAPHVSEGAKKSLLDRQQRKCAGCNCRVSAASPVQHILPKSLKGTDASHNLHLLCESCHGYEVKSIRLPRYILNRIDEWNKTKESFTGIVRIAILNHLSEEKADLEEMDRQKLRIDELEELVSNLRRKMTERDKNIRSSFIKFSDVIEGVEVKAKNPFSHYMDSKEQEKKFIHRRQG